MTDDTGMEQDEAKERKAKREWISCDVKQLRAKKVCGGVCACVPVSSDRSSWHHRPPVCYCRHKGTTVTTDERYSRSEEYSDSSRSDGELRQAGLLRINNTAS